MKGTPLGRRSRLRDAARRMSEGEYRWGRVDVTPPSRGAIVRYRVCVYPPGTNNVERRALAAHRDWPVLGAVIVLVALTVFGRVISPTPLLIGLVVGYVGVQCFTARFTASLRGRSRTVTATFVNLYDSVETHGDAESVSRVSCEFARLDARFHSGELTPARYELAWSSVFAGLPESAPAYSWVHRTRS
jgi:hypothetical protein